MKITKEIKELCQRRAEELELEFKEVVFVRESGMSILRVIVDKKGKLTTDDCSDLSMLISDDLDMLDIEIENYYLEVTSPGIERKLEFSELNEVLGSYVFVKLYRKIQGEKEFYGDLVSYEEDKVTLKINFSGRFKNVEFEKKDIALIRLAIKF
ncbi:MAG TPA: ribosome maturation factor RimP [Bacilli bacterium]|nr:ribosome maturation factor RimP [Bacilli bacterium]HOF43454.1 ribosome maturation factor RimP [Bacilli bacterium]HOR53021.1 ribosome maturation factor RimP [Bacilli bacterium]HPL58714.1 ribosome maturation factor RimP [Bacilli bacterium]